MKDEATMNQRPCETCQKPIPIDAYRSTKYCSIGCLEEAKRKMRKKHKQAAKEREKLARAEKRQTVMFVVTCEGPTCNNVITTNNPRTIYCSKWCKNKKYEERRDAGGYDRAESPEAYRKRLKDLGCAGCKHVKENHQSDTGYECTAGLYLACKPLSPGMRYKYEAKS